MSVVTFREAVLADLPALVAMLADDPLGTGREGGDMAPYRAAFDEIAADPKVTLLVAEEAGALIGTLQLTFLPGLSRKGARRALVEAVRIAADRRSQGLGAQLMAEAERRAREAGCTLVQLTSDRSRERAHAFYARIGYAQSHLGFKRALDS